MKKIILAALAILVSASFNTADAAAKKKKKKTKKAINGLISIAEWQERQRQAAIQQFVKRCEALYEQQRKERRN